MFSLLKIRICFLLDSSGRLILDSYVCRLRMLIANLLNKTLDMYVVAPSTICHRFVMRNVLAFVHGNNADTKIKNYREISISGISSFFPLIEISR